jgi:hypothetical protein
MAIMAILAIQASQGCAVSRHIVQTYATFQSDTPNVPAGFDALNPDLPSFTRSQFAYPGYAKTSASFPAFDSDIHSAIERSPDALQTSCYRGNVHGVSLDVKQFAIHVHAPDSHWQANRDPRFTSALAALCHVTILSLTRSWVSFLRGRQAANNLFSRGAPRLGSLFA